MPLLDWAKAAAIALRLVYDFVRWVEREKLTTAAQREIVDKAKAEINAEIVASHTLRSRVRAELDAHPERLRVPDKYLRPD